MNVWCNLKFASKTAQECYSASFKGRLLGSLEKSHVIANTPSFTHTWPTDRSYADNQHCTHHTTELNITKVRVKGRICFVAVADRQMQAAITASVLEQESAGIGFGRTQKSAKSFNSGPPFLFPAYFSFCHMTCNISVDVSVKKSSSINRNKKMVKDKKGERSLTSSGYIGQWISSARNKPYLKAYMHDYLDWNCLGQRILVQPASKNHVSSVVEFNLERISDTCHQKCSVQWTAKWFGLISKSLMTLTGLNTFKEQVAVHSQSSQSSPCNWVVEALALRKSVFLASSTIFLQRSPG
ncbi:hypothetical protein P5673_000933 [Acropora cervicornis]|uniref:Uncharacterized protein n=1 Tax=Acropora cervicornis TaxID=6130 RepID=A0AAD9R5M1_ACRCE|nr:hypothetical protein P5673_000933 [Acropora cervicornis]